MLDVDVNVAIDELNLESISSQLRRFAEVSGDRLPGMVRRAACYVCDSLRARTKTAKKYPKANEYSMRLSAIPPRYITYKKGVKLPYALHRWDLTRKIGTPDQFTKPYYVYQHTKINRRGNMVNDLTAEKKELKMHHLELYHRGLAKKSWDWAKGEITGNRDAVWRRRKKDRPDRDPTKAVQGVFLAARGARIVDASAEIRNRLDYIGYALQPGALNDAVKNANKKLGFAIDNELLRAY